MRELMPMKYSTVLVAISTNVLPLYIQCDYFLSCRDTIWWQYLDAIITVIELAHMACVSASVRLPIASQLTNCLNIGLCPASPLSLTCYSSITMQMSDDWRRPAALLARVEPPVAWGLWRYRKYRVSKCNAGEASKE
jgi:hypothetical protein